MRLVGRDRKSSPPWDPDKIIARHGWTRKSCVHEPNHEPKYPMNKTLQQLVRRSATEWEADPVNREQVERLAQVGLQSRGSYLSPTSTSAFGPFERFYQLIEPDNFTREDAAEFWGRFTFELPEDLGDESDIVDEFCDAVLDAVEQ